MGDVMRLEIQMVWPMRTLAQATALTTMPQRLPRTSTRGNPVQYSMLKLWSDTVDALPKQLQPGR